MTPIIDVHVLIRDNPNPEHLAQCLGSLEGQPINLHTLPWEPGHIGRGRIRGYAQGSAPWVCYVDDDDAVDDDLFQIAAPLLDESVGALSTNERALGDTAFERYGGVARFALNKCVSLSEHLCIFRRDLLLPLLPLYKDCPRGGDQVVLRAYIQAVAPLKLKGVLIKGRKYQKRGLVCGS